LAWQKRGRETTYLVQDLQRLMAQASEQEAWAIVGVVVTVPQAVSNIHHALQLVLRAGPVFAFPNGVSTTIPPSLEVEQLIWVTGFWVKGADDLLQWMDTVEQLSVHQRQNAFQGASAEQACLVTVDRVWWHESEKPKSDQRWDEALGVLQQVAERALQLDLELLWACAMRASIIVLGGYQEKLPEAAAFAEEALGRASADPRIRFLIEECTGRQYLGKHQEEEALRWLQRAIERPTPAFASLRLFGWLYASKCIGKQDAQAAIAYAQQGVEVGMASSEVPELDVVKAWGELAIAHWLEDERLAAFEAWDQAGKRLLACRAETDQWKSLFRAYGHVSGYFVSVVTTGQPPTEVQNGQPYVAPSRGFLLFSHPPAAGYNPTADAFLFAQLALFAEALGQDDHAVEWAEQGIDIALAARQTVAYKQLNEVLIPSLVKQQRYEEALDIALEVGLISKALSLHHTAGGNVLSPDFDAKAVLGSKPNGHWSDAEYQAAQMGLLPCIFHLGLLALTSPELIQDQAARVIAFCQEAGTTASNHYLWSSSTQLVEQIFLAKVGEKALHQAGNAFDSEYGDLLRYIAYLGATLQRDVSLFDAFSAQAAVLWYTSRLFKRSSTTYRSTILPFIRWYWLNMFEKKRALFSAPSLVEKELQAAQAEPEQDQVRALMTAIAYGVGGDVGLVRDI
jgi:hypothetical protein